MNTDEQTFATFASKVDLLTRKNELNNFQNILEIIWVGMTTYHGQTIKGEEFTEEQRKMVNKAYEALKISIEPII